MARIALLCPELLFASKVEGALDAAGHRVTRFDDDERARAAAGEFDLLVVDLTADRFDGAALVESMKRAGELEDLRTLGFYSHVDRETRWRAEEAGIDVVVPRSRMTREAARLAERLLEADPGESTP